MKFLLDNGADPNYSHPKYCIYDGAQAPLFWAINESNVESIKLLLNYGADINQPHPIGDTPLLRAKTKGEDIFSLLTNHQNKKSAAQKQCLRSKSSKRLCTLMFSTACFLTSAAAYSYFSSHK